MSPADASAALGHNGIIRRWLALFGGGLMLITVARPWPIQGPARQGSRLYATCPGLDGQVYTLTMRARHGARLIAKNKRDKLKSLSLYVR